MLYILCSPYQVVAYQYNTLYSPRFQSLLCYPTRILEPQKKRSLSTNLLTSKVKIGKNRSNSFSNTSHLSTFPCNKSSIKKRTTHILPCMYLRSSTIKCLNNTKQPSRYTDDKDLRFCNNMASHIGGVRVIP